MRVLALCLLSLHAAMLAWGALRHSVTLNERAHLPAGMSHWVFGRFELYRVNPPLVRMVAGAAVLFSGAKADWQDYDRGEGLRRESDVADRFVQLNGQESSWYYTLGRWACIPFSLLGGWVCFRWARELYGQAAGLVALVLWCFCPNVLGHAQLLTPDAGATALGITAAYMFWRWLRVPTWTGAFFSGVLLGAALLTKLTWIIVLALWPMLWLVCRQPWRRNTGSPARPAEIAQLALILAAALYTLNAGYGFEGSLTRLGQYQFVSQSLGGNAGPRHDAPRGNRFAGTRLGALPVPLPKNYVLGIDLQKRDFERGFWSYLRGQWRYGGWWYYYLYGLAVKVPLGTWALAIAAVLASLGRMPFARPWRDEIVLVAPAVAVLALVSSQTGFNHHLRYVLPMFPFAFVWMSKVAQAWELGHRKLQKVVVVAVAWSLASSVWIYPHSLSYFNELVGGPMRGYEHMDNSNIDWGQDWLYFKRWLERHPEACPLGIAYSFAVDPGILGVQYAPVPSGPDPIGRRQAVRPESLGPQPGWYAISVNELIHPHEPFAYFRHLKPAARVGYSILVYHVTEEEADHVRRRLGLPPLGDETPRTPPTSAGGDPRSAALSASTW